MDRIITRLEYFHVGGSNIQVRGNGHYELRFGGSVAIAAEEHATWNAIIDHALVRVVG